MDSQETFEFSEENVQRLKDRYSKELRNSEDNPIKVCMKLIFSAAIEKDSTRRESIAYDLSVLLTKPDGIINLFLALIDFDTTSQKVTTHNQRFIAIANIITHLPRFCLPYEKFCENVCNQLKPLLLSDNSQYSSLASIIIQSMFDSPNAKSKDISSCTLGPIFAGLIRPNSTYKPHHTIVAINNLINCRLQVTRFVRIFPHIFYSYLTLNRTPSRLKGLLQNSLTSILNGLKPEVSCCLLEQTLFYSPDVVSLYQPCSEDDEISLRVIGDEEHLESDVLVDNVQVELNVLSLLEYADNELLFLHFFFHFQEVMWTAREEQHQRLSANLIEPLLTMSIKEEESSKLNILSVIADNRERSIELISRTLLNYVTILRDKKQDELHQPHKLVEQSLNSCLDIIEVLSSVLQNIREVELLKGKCLSVLREIQESLTGFDKTIELSKRLCLLVQDIEARAGSTSSKSIPDNLGDSEYVSLINDLNDKLVPVQVHALVRLKQMVMVNENFIRSRICQLVPFIEAFLSNAEPYVYLAAINLLVEMTLRETSQILPILIDRHSKQDLDVQVRTNMGEVLVRVTKQLNETTPHYAQQVMNNLMYSCKDPEELIRMSSLTNIGEICGKLGNSLGKYMVDILTMIESIVMNDSTDVKCASIDLLRTTLMGLDKISVESIQRELKSIYDLLKRLRRQSFDEELCKQVDLALDEIDRIAREFFDVKKESKIHFRFPEKVKYIEEQ